MRKHTQAFKDGIKQYGRQFNDTISSGYNDGQDDMVVIVQSRSINRVNYSVDTTLLKSVMQTLEVELATKLDDRCKVLAYTTSLVGVNNSAIEFKNFNIEKVEEKKDTKSYVYTCYDNMIKAMTDYESFYSATSDSTFTTDKNYYQLDNGKYTRYTGARTGNPSSLGLYESDFPMTTRTYINKICTRLGITFKNASDTFTNYDQNVTSEHYVDIDNNSLGYTFRDVLDDLAECVGGFICIDDNGQLEIRYITQAVGKNLFNIDEYPFISKRAYNGTTGAVNNWSGYCGIDNYFPVEPNTTYTFSNNYNANIYYGLCYYDNTKTFISGTNTRTKTFTTPNNCHYIRFAIQNNIPTWVQIEKSSQATDYEPYGDTINEDYFNDKNVNIGKQITYNTLVLSRGDDSDNIYRPTTLPANPVEFKISDNPILEQTNREDFIDGIFNNINGLSFYTNDFATKGILYYEVGDKYNVNIGGIYYPCLLLSDNIKRTQGLVENIHTDEPKQSVTPYKYASTTDKLEIQSRNAYIIADKANGTASMIVEGIGSNGQVTGASVIASINNDSSQVSIDADKININGVVSANNSFTIDTNGNMSCNNANITGGYLELTDDPDTQDDRLIIKKKNSTELTTITSEYVLTKKAQSDDYNYSQMSLDSGLAHGVGTDSNNFKSSEINQDTIILTKRENGVTTRSNYRSDGATINGDTTIGGNLVVGSVEGGTWTPTLDSANVTYDRQYGYYRKIGDLVFATFMIYGKINSVSSQGYAFINGLPYSAGIQQAGSLFECANCFSDNNSQWRLLRVVGSQLGIQNGNDGGTSISFWASGKGTFYLSGSITYFI